MPQRKYIFLKEKASKKWVLQNKKMHQNFLVFSALLITCKVGKMGKGG